MKNSEVLYKVISEEIECLERAIKHSYIKSIPALSFIIIVLSRVLYKDTIFLKNNFKEIIYWFAFVSNLVTVIFLMINQLYRSNSIGRLGKIESSELDKRKNFFGHLLELFQYIVMLIANLIISKILFESSFIFSIQFILFAIMNYLGLRQKWIIILIDYIQKTDKTYKNNEPDTSHIVEQPRTNESMKMVWVSIILLIFMFFSMIMSKAYIVNKSAFEFGGLLALMLPVLNIIIISTGQVFHIKWLEQLRRMLLFNNIDYNKAQKLLYEEHYNSFRSDLLFVEKEHFENIT